MTLQEIHGKLRAQFGDAVGELTEAIDPWSVVPGERLVEICTWLRDTPGLEMDFLQDETASDHPEDNQIRVVYHLFSYQHRHGMKFKVELDRADPNVPTLEGVWPVANWFEREIADLFGVTFEGHSDPRALMLPDDWVGHPLRKDYEEPESYHGISHQRFSPIEGYSAADAILRKAAEAEKAELEGASEEGASPEPTVH